MLHWNLWPSTVLLLFATFALRAVKAVIFFFSFQFHKVLSQENSFSLWIFILWQNLFSFVSRKKIQPLTKQPSVKVSFMLLHKSRDLSAGGDPAEKPKISVQIFLRNFSYTGFFYLLSFKSVCLCGKVQVQIINQVLPGCETFMSFISIHLHSLLSRSVIIHYSKLLVTLKMYNPDSYFTRCPVLWATNHIYCRLLSFSCSLSY